METTILTEINPISYALGKLANNVSDRRYLDYLLENYDQDELKTELIKFSKDFLLSTVQSEIAAQKRYKRKLCTFDELVKYLLKNVCSKDQLRPQMNAVYYDKEQSNLVSTDAYILTILPLKKLPISDIAENVEGFLKNNDLSYLIKYTENSFKLDKYGDILNQDLDAKYPNYKAVYPTENYLDYPYFSINPLLFNGLKTLNKIAKKLKIVKFPIKLSCLENKAFINLDLLIRAIDLHQKIKGNYEYLTFTRNGNEIAKILYNLDLSNDFKFLVMPIIVEESEENLTLDLNNL
jgi:hypothetical protein